MKKNVFYILLLLAVSQAQSIYAEGEGVVAGMQEDPNARSNPEDPEAVAVYPTTPAVDERAIAESPQEEKVEVVMEAAVPAPVVADGEPAAPKKKKRNRRRKQLHVIVEKKQECDPNVVEKVMKQTQISQAVQEKEKIVQEECSEKAE